MNNFSKLLLIIFFPCFDICSHQETLGETANKMFLENFMEASNKPRALCHVLQLI